MLFPSEALKSEVIQIHGRHLVVVAVVVASSGQLHTQAQDL
jgi:hypothetical protein